MKEYTKIDTIFERDVQGTKKMIMNKFRNPSVEYLKDNQWLFTEKIDGTNIRIEWDGHKINFAGRTDNSSIPSKLIAYLRETFDGPINEELFEQKFGGTPVILFGEGYGANMSKEKNYRNDVSFILFDVQIQDAENPNKWWFLNRDSVEDIAKTFGVDAVPIIGQGTLDEAVKIVLTRPKSTIGTANMEGIVARPIVDLYDRAGKRIIVKIKVKDFEEVK